MAKEEKTDNSKIIRERTRTGPWRIDRKWTMERAEIGSSGPKTQLQSHNKMPKIVPLPVLRRMTAKLGPGSHSNVHTCGKFRLEARSLIDNNSQLLTYHTGSL
jgi:hypothetical protein